MNEHVSSQRTTEIFSHLDHHCHRMKRENKPYYREQNKKNIRNEAYNIY